MNRPVIRRRDGAPPGLPRQLPEGETPLWQGAPDWRGIARRALHLRKLALYLGAVLLWCAISAARAPDPARAASATLWLAALGGAALGLLALFAWFVARSTTYTITSRRIVMQVGVALTMNVNLPLRQVDGAALRLHPDGSGDIPLALRGRQRIGYLLLWPHVRPWRVGRPQPMLRAVPDAARVAELLARALLATVGEKAAAETVSGQEADTRKPAPKRASRPMADSEPLRPGIAA